MRYLLLMYVDRGLTPPADAVARYATLREEMSAADVYVASGQLEADDDTAVVRVDGDTATVIDGGLATKGTAPGAFYLIECDTRDQAIAWAARIPAAEYGSVEVRPLRLVPAPVVGN